MVKFKSYFVPPLLLEYSEAFINKLAQTLITGTDITVDQAKRFIQFFDTIRNTAKFAKHIKDNQQTYLRNNKPITNIKDIAQFNIQQLEIIYDNLSEQTEDEVNKEITADADLVFPSNVNQTIREINPSAVEDPRYLEIYSAGNREKCIKFSHDMFGKSYTFCIGRKDASNMYTNYRYGRVNATSFYFVRDYSRPYTDNNHLLVIQIKDDGTYVLTIATNMGDRPVTWEEIVNVQPKLKNLKHIFKFIPYTEAELEYKTIHHSSPKDFKQLSQRLKNAYISSGKKLLYEDYTTLSTEEQNLYLNIFINSIDRNYFKTSSAVFHIESEKIFDLLDDLYPNYTAIENQLSTVRHANYYARVFTSLINILLIKAAAYGTVTTKNVDINQKNKYDEFEYSKRDVPRLQPFKFFKNKIMSDTSIVSGEVAAENLKKTSLISTYKDFANIFNYPDSTNYSNTQIPIKLRDKICIIRGTKTNGGSINITWNFSTENSSQIHTTLILYVFDEDFNLLNKPAFITDITPQGIVVSDNINSNNFIKIVNFENNELNVKDVDREEIINNSVVTRVSTLRDFKNLSEKRKKRFLDEYIDKLKKFVSIGEGGTQQFSNYMYATENKLNNIIPFDKDSITELLRLMYSKIKQPAINDILGSFSSHLFNVFYLLIFAKDFKLPNYEEVKNLCTKYIEMVESNTTTFRWLATGLSYYSSGTTSLFNKNKNRLFLPTIKSNTVKGAIYDIDKLNISILGHIMMYTQNQIVFGDFSKGNIKDIKCYNRETLEASSEELNTRFKNNIDNIIKSENGQTVFARTCIDYTVNKKLFNSVAEKLKDKKLYQTETIPPYSCIIKTPVDLTNLIELNLNTPEEKDKYHNLLSNFLATYSAKSNREGAEMTSTVIKYFTSFMNAIKSTYNIDLKSIYLRPSVTDKRGHSYDMFFRYSAHEDPYQYNTEFFIQLDSITVTSKKVNQRWLLPSMTFNIKDKNNLNFMSGKFKAQVFIRRPGYQYLNVQNHSLYKFCQILGKAYNSKKNAKTILEEIAKYVLGTVYTDDLLNKFLAKNNTQTTIQDSYVVPFAKYFIKR